MNARNLPSYASALLLLTLALPLTAAADKVIYKVIDKNGKVSYTDTPPPSNVKYEVLKLKAPEKRPAPAQAKPKYNSWSRDREANESTPVFRGYRSIEITSPGNDDTILHDQLEVPVKLALTPNLQQNHKLQLVFDGEPLDESSGRASFILRELERGSHQVQINVLDESGKVIASSNSVTFHVKRPITQGALAAPKL